MTNKLYRSRKNCVIGGVCGGLDEYFDIDPIIIGLLLILFFFMDGAGLVAYLIAWIIIPKNPDSNTNHYLKYEKEIIDLEKNIDKDAEKKWLMNANRQKKVDIIQQKIDMFFLD